MEDLLGPRVFTNQEKLAELKRELEMRKKVYPRHNPGGMGHGYISPAKQRQVAIIEAIIADYQEKQ